MSITHLTAAEKQAVLEQVARLATGYEQKYGNCPQCVLKTINDIFGGVDSRVFQAAFGFGAGTGLSSVGICGALNAAVMLISTVFGRTYQGFQGEIDSRCTETIRRFMHKFSEQYGGMLCCELQTALIGRAFDLTIDEDRLAFRVAGGYGDKCPQVVAYAAVAIAELILGGNLPWPVTDMACLKKEAGIWLKSSP